MASIKITALPDIAGNLAFTTIIPVVDMNGTPVSDKANLQIVGNLFLSGAGGANFVAAAHATTAGTVTTAAQPNITSVGTLSGVTINGVTNLGAVGNVTITGGSATNVLTTDGAGNLSWGVGGGGLGSSGYSGVSGYSGFLGRGCVLDLQLERIITDHHGMPSDCAAFRRVSRIAFHPIGGSIRPRRIQVAVAGP